MILGRRSPLVLSPMVDVTDAAFRSVAAEWGADVTCSEMVSANGLIHGNQKSWRLVRPWPDESPYGVQLMGGDPDRMAQAVAQVRERIDPDFIDLNLGCPSPNILRSCAGGFLLRDPNLAGHVIRAAVDAADGTPLSVKMRLGHDDAHRTFLDVGNEAQAAGAAWCTLHGRTVVQGYSGAADWSAIGQLVDALDIPVIGNGDLNGPDDVVRMQAETDCAGFFIARAAMHDPTVFRRMRQALDGEAPEPAADLATRIRVLQTYLERCGDEPTPLAVLKRQATRFLQAAPGAKRLRVGVHEAPDRDAIVRLLEVAVLDDGQGTQQEHADEGEA